MTLSNMQIAIMGTILNAHPRKLSGTEIFWALPAGDHSLLNRFWSSVGELRRDGLVTYSDLPELTPKGVALLTDSCSKFGNGVSNVPRADSCGHGAQRDAATVLRERLQETETLIGQTKEAWESPANHEYKRSLAFNLKSLHRQKDRIENQIREVTCELGKMQAGNQAPESICLRSGASGKCTCPEFAGACECLKDSCGSAEGSLGNGCASLSATLAGAISPAVGVPDPPAGSDGRLDAAVQRIQAVHSDWSPEFSYICEDCGKTFLANDVVWLCELCADPAILCPRCYDGHMEAGHTLQTSTQPEKWREADD